MKNKIFHSLWLKLLLVNLVAPVILISGMLFINDYESALEEAEFKNLETQAELLSLSFDRYWVIMQEVQKLPSLRAQIFTHDGSLLADSQLENDRNIIELSHLVSTLTEGEIIKNINRSNKILDIIIPVYSVKGSIKGAVRIYTSSLELDNKIWEVKKGLLIISGITLLVTIVLSLFFARNLIVPLNKLAKVAHQLEDREKVIEIPDYSSRKDEIGQLSIALSTMLQSIRVKLQSFEDFASDVSHEIKNPLTSILSASQTVQKIQDAEKKDKLLKIIFNDVERLNRLITDISSISKVSAEIGEERLEKIKIVQLIKELAKVYQYNPDNQKIVINYDEKIKNIKVMAKETRIAQIFNNLVGNAMSFSKKDDEIEIKLEKRGSYLIWSTIDKGKGFSDGSEEKMFTRFYQDRDSEQSHKHSGLGLALSKAIIDNLGGKIYAAQNKPKGAIFTIELPIIIN